MAGESPALGAFFLSGAAALVFEVAWFHRAGLVFGNSLWAVTIVLSAFMGGLAIGNALVARYAVRIRRPLAVYAILELAVGGFGIAAVYVLPTLTGIVVPTARLLPEGSIALNATRLVTAFAVLVVPATAMGATLPVLAGAVGRARSFGGVLGRLYGFNTLGAVFGVIASEIWFVRLVGVAGAAWLAASLNVAAAAIAFRLSAHSNAAPDVPPPAAKAAGAPPRSPHVLAPWLIAAAGLAGAALMALEVVWFRFLSTYVLTTTLAVSLMLAVVLASIGIGSLIAAAVAARDESRGRMLPAVALAAAVTTLAAYASFGSLTSGAQVGDWRTVLWFAIVLTAPTAAASGALFTMIGGRLRAALVDRTRAAAWLTAANTTGALTGPPLATFVLLPALGMDGAIAAVAIVYLAIAAAAARSASPAPARRTIGLTSAAAAAVLVAFTAANVGDRYVARAAAPYAADGSTIVETREGPSETILLMQQRWLGQPVYSRLVTNGFSMTGTAVPGQRYMKYFAYWPMMLHDGPIRRALLVCYGLGVTAGAILDLPELERMDVAEISSDVIAVNRDLHGSASPLADPRARLHLEDGRYFLESATDRFDLITGEPPPPRTPGAVNIYTREYFSLVHDRLNPGGIATYWVPVARPDPGADVDTIIRAFCDVFDDCTLWNATPFDFMLAGSRTDGAPSGPAPIVAPFANPALAAKLRDVGFERPEQIGATFLADRPALEALTSDTPPLVDDFPQRLNPNPSRPSLSDPDYATDAAAQARYQDLLDPGRARQRFAASPFVRAHWPADLREATLPYFEHQRTLNRVLWEGGKPLRQIDDLDALLSGTTLEQLPLWLLGSDAVKASIAASQDDGTGAAEYARGLTALATRDYSGAVSWFVKADSRGFEGATVRPLAAYALCREGDRAAAARVGSANPAPADPDAVHFWRWMGEHCGVGPFR